MKRTVWLMSLTLALPMVAFANSVDFTNGQGTLSGTSAGPSLSGSTLIAAVGPTQFIMGNLGSLTFSTGALTSGTMQMGATLDDGGSFVITGNGTSGMPNGVIFNGSFTGPLTWGLITLADGTHNYTLTGALTGTWFTGQKVNGAVIQLTTNVGKGFFNGSTTLSSGDISIIGNGLVIVVTPEPASMVFFGTGLVGLAGIIRRKSRR